MKKVLAVIGIVLPFVFGFAWVISFALLGAMVGEPTSTVILLSYIKIGAMIGTLVWLITLVIGIIYLWREKGFSHKEIIPLSRKLMRKNIRKFSLGIILLFVFQMIQNGLSDPNQPTTIVVAILTLLLVIAYLRVDFGLKGMSIALVDEKKVKVTDIFAEPKLFFNYFIAYIITWVFTVIGVILFIAPGVFVGLRLNMVPYLIFEKKLGPWEAIKQSRTLTKGKASNIFALNILLGGINLLGLLAMIVGLFWTIPFFYIANAVFYKKLLSHKK